MSGRGYLGEVGLSLDRFINAFLGGSADHSISASIGARAAAGDRRAHIAETIIDWFFVVLRGAPWGHCLRQAQREGLIG